MSAFNRDEVSQKMNKTIASFKKDLGTLRTGRANPAMLDLIRVDVYGQKMPINQLATVTVPEARTISIQVWDKNNVKLVDSEIQKSNLGVTPQVDGQIIRIHIPQLTEERRKELTKVLKNLGEKGKVSIRNIRRECNDNIKQLLKEKKISEDENSVYEKEIQKSTDDNIALIDKILLDKEKEILTL
jgi:ribosome recycling factor